MSPTKKVGAILPNIFDTIPVIRDVQEIADIISHNNELSIDESLLSSQPPKKKKLNIPICDVSIDGIYEKNVAANYKLPDSYIRYNINIGDEVDISVDYIMEKSDEIWLKGQATILGDKEVKNALTPDKFEAVINILEKHTGFLKDPLPQINFQKLLCDKFKWSDLLTSKILPLVYQYWLCKRTTVGKPLCRRYWPQVTSSDTDPHQVFRTRDREKYKLRKQHKRNDVESFRKMQQLKRDFSAAQTLMHLIIERESLREAEFEVQREIFYQKLFDIDNKYTNIMNPSNGFSDDKPNGSSGYRNGNSISRGDPDIKGSNGSDRSNHSNGNHASNGNISPLRITPVEERLTPTVTTGDRSSCSSHESNMDVVPNDGIALDISTDSNNSIFKYEKNEHKLVNGHYNGDSKSKHLNGSNGSFQSSLDITIIPSKTNFRYKLKFPHLLQEENVVSKENKKKNNNILRNKSLNANTAAAAQGKIAHPAVNGTEKNNAIVPSIVDETKKKLDKKEKKKEKNGLKLQANANSTTDMSGLSNKNGNLSITDVATEFADVDVTVEDLDEAVAIDPKFLIHPDLPGPDHFCQPSWPSFMEHLPTRQNPTIYRSLVEYMEELEFRPDELPHKYRCRSRLARGGRIVVDRIPVYEDYPSPSVRMDFFSEKDLLYPSFSDSDSDEEEPKAPIPRLAVNNRHSNGKYYYPTSLKYNSNISKAILTGIVGDNNDSLVTNYNGKNGIHKPVEYVNHGKNGKSGHVSTNYGSSNAQTTIDANNPQQSFFVPDPSKSNDRTEMDEELHPLDNSFQFLDDDVNLFGFDDYMFGNEPIPLDPSTNASLPTKQNDTNTSYQLDSTKSMVNLPPLPVIPLTNTSYEYYEQQLLQLNGNNGNNSNSNKNNRNKSINTNNLRRAKPSLPPTLPPCRSGQQKLNQAKLSEIYRVKDQEYSKIYFGYLPEKYGESTIAPKAFIRL